MNIKEKFGLKVKNLREQKGFSIEYLANISNVDRNYLIQISFAWLVYFFRNIIVRQKKNWDINYKEVYIFTDQPQFYPDVAQEK